MVKDRESRRRIRLQVVAAPGSKVHVAGSFNNWDPDARPLKQKTNGLFTTHMLLPKGRYEYKFVINGTWTVDPECTHWERNSMGSLNSVLVVN